ncbi:MAG: acetyl-CoA carboxylase biotin carboxyl carrier protein [Neomegalonema sp.]|nr:acetyl-CoA carboxylase biotin carboxyl carrier protein [Neomegalonema sp.]
MTESKKSSSQSSRSEADVAFVEALARVLKENDLAELEVTREYGEDDELTVRLARYAAPAPVYAEAPRPAMSAPAPIAAAAAPMAAPSAAPSAAADQQAADLSNHPGAVVSPMVGTAYLAPEPGAPEFVSVGQSVTEGQTIVIVEAMKTMNHIPAPRSGVVKQIIVSNEEPVEYGALLMIIE